MYPLQTPTSTAADHIWSWTKRMRDCSVCYLCMWDTSRRAWGLSISSCYKATPSRPECPPLSHQSQRFCHFRFLRRHCPLWFHWDHHCPGYLSCSDVVFFLSRGLSELKKVLPWRPRVFLEADGWRYWAREAMVMRQESLHSTVWVKYINRYYIKLWNGQVVVDHYDIQDIQDIPVISLRFRIMIEVGA